MKKLLLPFTMLTISFFTLNSCQEEISVEAIDSNLLIGEWQGEETWDSYQNNILHTSTNDMYLKFTQEGKCTLYVENSAEDTIYYEWFYIAGNHKLFLTREYTGLEDTTRYNTYSSQYHDIQTINNEQLIIEKTTSFPSQGNTYRSEFNWNLNRIK